MLRVARLQKALSGGGGLAFMALRLRFVDLQFPSASLNALHRTPRRLARNHPTRGRARQQRLEAIFCGVHRGSCCWKCTQSFKTPRGTVFGNKHRLPICKPLYHLRGPESPNSQEEILGMYQEMRCQGSSANGN